MTGKRFSKRTPKRKKKCSDAVFRRKSNSTSTLDCLYKNTKLPPRRKCPSKDSSSSLDVFCGITSTNQNLKSNSSIGTQNLLRGTRNRSGEVSSEPTQEERYFQILSKYLDATDALQNEIEQNAENDCRKFQRKETNNSLISLREGAKKPRESGMNTEDVSNVKKLLTLLRDGVKINRRKSSSIQNSSTLEAKGKPVNVFAKLLSKIKGKPKNQSSGQNAGDTNSNDHCFGSFDSIQRTKGAPSKFEKFRIHEQKSSADYQLNTPRQRRIENPSANKTWKGVNNLINHKQKPIETNDEIFSDTRVKTGSNGQLEAELRNLRRHFAVLENKERAQHDLEDQLEDVKSELKEKNEILENAKIQFTLQLTALSQELGTAEDVLKQSQNSAEVLLEDMLKIKEKLALDIKWNVYEASKNSLSRLIKISRSFVNDLADRLITSAKELETERKKTETYEEENAKLLELAEESKGEMKSLLERAKNVEALEARGEDQIRIIERQTLAAKELEELLKEAADDVKKLKEKLLGKDVQLESLKLEAQTLREHVAGLSQIILAAGTGDAIRELVGAKDQLSALQATYEQVLRERNCAVEKLDQYELERSEFEENRDKIEQVLKQQSGELRTLRSENSEMGEQLAKQQSTLAALQNERVRHLEEKNFLNAMFSKLQEEFGRIEQLEGALFNVNQEANRLTVIAEYNKQLGEVLQHEVSERDAVIVELRKDVETLDGIQRENAQDKMALHRKLTEACSMKDVLHGELDEQIKKSTQLTEVQRTAEFKTSKDLEAAREMQSRERGAVKEIIADFDALVLQRGDLLEKQAKTTLKMEGLRAKNRKLRGKIAKSNQFIYEKISVVMQLERDVSEKENEIQRLNLDLQDQSAKHAKETGKLKSEGKRLSKERESLQESLEYSRKNAEKLQGDLNEARHECEDLLLHKTKELSRAEALYDGQTLELQRTREESDQLVAQLDNLVHQKSDLEQEMDALVVRVNNLERDAEGETALTKQELKIKTEKLVALEEKYEAVEKLCDHLSRDFEDVAVENRKLKNAKLELIAERETLIMSNDALKEDVQILCNKLESIEERDECMKTMLQKTVDDGLVDKSCYGKLEEAHKDLAQKLLRTAHLLIDEKLGRLEMENKLNDCMHRLSEVEAEKLTMVRKTEAVYEELAKCKGKIKEMTEEGDRVAQMFNESKSASLDIRAKYEEFEAQFNDYKEKYESLRERYNILITDDNRHNGELFEAKERIEELKTELNCKHELVLNLQDENARLQQDVASAEFERRQINIQLCDTARELRLQRELSRNLELIHKRALAAISDMTDKGILRTSECETVFVIHSSDE